jgi:DNA-binding NarL/FixJ family response regulator
MINDLPVSNTFDDAKLSELTSREKEVALLLKEGKTYKNIAQKLDITPRTVKAHAGHIYTKLNVKDRLALALLLK